MIPRIRFLMFDPGCLNEITEENGGMREQILWQRKIRPGYYPVVSMTDGVVTEKGWLEKGGWRIGITAPTGAYFYYAHLDSLCGA